MVVPLWSCPRIYLDYFYIWNNVSAKYDVYIYSYISLSVEKLNQVEAIWWQVFKGALQNGYKKLLGELHTHIFSLYTVVLMIIFTDLYGILTDKMNLNYWNLILLIYFVVFILIKGSFQEQLLMKIHKKFLFGRISYCKYISNENDLLWFDDKFRPYPNLYEDMY